MAHERGYSNYVVFEDDLVFRRDPEETRAASSPGQSLRHKAAWDKIKKLSYESILYCLDRPAGEISCGGRDESAVDVVLVLHVSISMFLGPLSSRCADAGRRG